MKPIQILSFFIVIGVIFANNCAAKSSEITKGEEVYRQYCQGCHGIKAIGQDPENPNGGLNDENQYIAPALNGKGHTWHHPPIFLFQQIKNRKINKLSPMPPFSGILSDDEINAVIAYIKSLWPDEIRKKYYEKFNE
jgi:mono/diheme cytochrome c family protein